MKDMSNEELINKFRAMCNLFIIYGKFQKDPDFNEANKISDKLLSRLSAGEEAVKKVAELEKLNDKYRQDTQDNYGDIRGTIKFRKKPIVNEAIRWTGDNLREIIDFTGLHPSAQKWTWEEYEEVVKNEGLKIFTLEGPLFASVGDYIMRGVNGELYPIKPGILAKTYDRVG